MNTPTAMRALPIVLVSTLLLSGCGNKGPLLAPRAPTPAEAAPPPAVSDPAGTDQAADDVGEDPALLRETVPPAEPVEPPPPPDPDDGAG